MKVKMTKFMKGNWSSAILSPICIILDSLGMMAVPYATALIIDKGIASGDISYITKLGLITVVVCFFAMFAGFLAMFFSSKAAYGFGKNLRQAMMEKIQEFSFNNINKFTTSSLITRDVDILSQLVQMMLRMMIRTPVLLVTGTIMMLKINSKLSSLFIVLIPVIALMMTIVIFKAFPMFKKVQTKIDKVNNVIRENLIGARVVKSFVREEYENNRFNKANTELMDINIKSFNIMIILMPLVTLIMNLAIAGVLWIGSSGTVEVGALSSGIQYMTVTLTSLIMLSMVFMNFSRAKASYDRIKEVLETEPDITNNSSARKKNKITKGKVEYNVKKFAFEDSNGEAILENIKFTVNPGEEVAIIGSTGTGKSTLVNLMPRFYEVTDGFVKIDGRDVRDYTLENLRDAIGFVLQENRLFAGTIAENIKWGKSDATLEEIKHACKVAQIDEFIESLPDKYESRVEQRGANFSGGQKQRLAIARALIKKPKILILDDSVSALDATTENNLRAALKTEFSDTTIFLIVQKIKSCKTADKVLVIDDGTIVGNGTHDELIESNEIYKEINESQKEVMPE